MKLDLRKTLARRPSGSGPAAPKFLRDLYGDLRDRRLLLPALALLAAIVAVPVLLASGSAEAPPPPAPPPATAQESAVTPAVLAEVGGVRNYRKRLAALKRTNPFEQQFTSQPKSARIRVEEGSAASVSVDDSGGAATAAEITSSSADAGSSGSISVESVSGTTETETTVETDGSEGSASETVETVEQPTVYTGTADITFGPAGAAKRYRAVERFEMLPDPSRPVIAFLGLSDDGERAYFLVASTVTATDGDGRCTPKPPAACQIVELGVGEQRTLTVEDEGVTYRLRLTGTDLEPVQRARGD